MSRSALERGAPELAAIAHRTLTSFGVAMLATIRTDGTPRTDPVEPVFADGELLFGSGRRTAKSRNLLRDPRCALHGLVSRAHSGDPDVKFFGHVEASELAAGWWAESAEGADIYALRVEEAVAITWDLPASRERIYRWSARTGATVRERRYP